MQPAWGPRAVVQTRSRGSRLTGPGRAAGGALMVNGSGLIQAYRSNRLKLAPCVAFDTDPGTTDT